MIRRALAGVIAVLALSLLVKARSKTHNDSVFSQINSIVKSLSDISGLTQLHSVTYGRISKRHLHQFLTKRIKKTLKPSEIYADELALKMFGLVPQNFDLRKSTIDLLTEQAAAFYDYDQKRLFLLEPASVSSEATTLAHELAHALADQHFNLSKFVEDTPSNDDENLAHTAVVEGQASWLMVAYDLVQAGQLPVPTLETLKAVADSSESSLADFPVLKASPLYIQESLLFPYTQGTLFFDAVFHRMGKRAFSAVFTNAPVDSAQVMHPDRYFDHSTATKPLVPELDSTDQQREITEGSVGEFDHEMLLRQYLGEQRAKEVSPHLRGGQFRIVASGKEAKPLLEYSSEWDSEEEARVFFADYRQVLERKWKHCTVSSSEGTTIAGLGDNGYFVTRLSGVKLTSMEGLSEPAEGSTSKLTRPSYSRFR